MQIGGPTAEDRPNGDLAVQTLCYFYALFMFCLSPIRTAKCGRIAAYVLFNYLYFVILLDLGF
jgi:hypothetical protein